MPAPTITSDYERAEPTIQPTAHCCCPRRGSSLCPRWSDGGDEMERGSGRAARTRSGIGWPGPQPPQLERARVVSRAPTPASLEAHQAHVPRGRPNVNGVAVFRAVRNTESAPTFRRGRYRSCEVGERRLGVCLLRRDHGGRGLGWQRLPRRSTPARMRSRPAGPAFGWIG